MCFFCTLLALSKLVLLKFTYECFSPRCRNIARYCWPGAWNPKTNREHETIPNVTPTRVITASLPSYTRYLNPHGSLVSRRWDLVKATQPIPVSKLRVVSYDPFTGDVVRRPYLSATPFLVHPIELYHYTSITSVFTDRLHDGLLARVTLFAYPSMGNHLMTSISVSHAWLNIFLFETTLVLWRIQLLLIKLI